MSRAITALIIGVNIMSLAVIIGYVIIGYVIAWAIDKNRENSKRRSSK